MDNVATVDLLAMAEVELRLQRQANAAGHRRAEQIADLLDMGLMVAARQGVATITLAELVDAVGDEGERARLQSLLDAIPREPEPEG